MISISLEKWRRILFFNIIFFQLKFVKHECRK